MRHSNYFKESFGNFGEEVNFEDIYWMISGFKIRLGVGDIFGNFICLGQISGRIVVPKSRGDSEFQIVDNLVREESNFANHKDEEMFWQ